MASRAAAAPLARLPRGSANVNVVSEPPHPWLADVPPAFARLVSVGHVRLRVDDPLLQTLGRSAVTQAAMTTHYQFRYALQPLPSAPDTSRAELRVHFLKPAWTLEHTISVRSDFQPHRPWESALLRHEFDHVAISTDPRLIRLLGWLELRRVVFPLSWRPNDAVSDSVLTAEVERQLRLRREALEALVRAYYDRLDTVSHDGLEAIPQRASFFRNLYTMKDLQSLRFAYLDEIAGVLKSVPMNQVERHYMLPSSERAPRARH